MLKNNTKCPMVISKNHVEEIFMLVEVRSMSFKRLGNISVNRVFDVKRVRFKTRLLIAATTPSPAVR
jgi:hypothetical protein